MARPGAVPGEFLSHTASNYWLLHLLPENAVIINEADAARRGLKDGEAVRIISASNPEGVWDLGNGRTKPMTGKLKTIQVIRPGAVAFSLGTGTGLRRRSESSPAGSTAAACA